MCSVVTYGSEHIGRYCYTLVSARFQVIDIYFIISKTARSSGQLNSQKNCADIFNVMNDDVRWWMQLCAEVQRWQPSLNYNSLSNMYFYKQWRSWLDSSGSNSSKFKQPVGNWISLRGLMYRQLFKNADKLYFCLTFAAICLIEELSRQDFHFA